VKAKAGTRTTESRRTNPERHRYFEARWAKLRAVVLRRDGHLCQECLRQGKTQVGNQVDHILPADQRPDLFYREDNLQTLCRKCHALKTRKGE